jgi:hypothetical protein
LCLIELGTNVWLTTGDLCAVFSKVHSFLKVNTSCTQNYRKHVKWFHHFSWFCSTCHEDHSHYTRDPYFFLLTIVSGNCHIRLSDRESYLNDFAGPLGFIGGAIEGGEWLSLFFWKWGGAVGVLDAHMLLLHVCGIITCQLWSMQLGFKDMGADTPFFSLINFATSWQYFFVFVVGLLFLTTLSFFLSFFQGTGMPEFNALLNTLLTDGMTGVISWIMYVRICGLKISLCTYVLGWCFSPQPKP